MISAKSRLLPCGCGLDMNMNMDMFMDMFMDMNNA